MQLQLHFILTTQSYVLVILFPSRMYNLSLYYMSEEGEDSPFICSAPRENGMLRCHDVPPYTEGGAECSLAPPRQSSALIGSTPAAEGASVNGCINLNLYYNVCRPGDLNPHKGAVNFDNIGYAWIAIFQVRKAESAFLDLYHIHAVVEEGRIRLAYQSASNTHYI